MDTDQTANIITDDLLPGDLLFQLRCGGEAEWVISRLFAGRNGMAINHVAIYDGDGQVVEAVMPEVRKTSMDEFVQNSVLDNHGRPCVLVCRVLADHVRLVAQALTFAEDAVAHTYDHHYSNSKHSWYCSELIIDAFRHANGGEFLFEETPMSFRDMDSGELIPFWVDHYRLIGQPVPEGEPGSHPALLSCSDDIRTIKVMGMLPVKGISTWLNQEPGFALA